jgi:UDP-N-acetylglucosamine--N-acetylmuramyl-(pentapeptide) pyrophosphoryl-undecaprenol N-acetylglucosamine transferase
MHVAIACGGTGGHIFPGLATAAELRKRGHKVTLWLGGRGVESASVENWDGKVVAVQASGFPSGFSFQSVRVATGLVRAVLTCRKRMKLDRPDVLLAMGSYASVGPALAARSLGIPFVVHEANAVPGRAAAFLAHFASAIAVTFSKTSGMFGGRKTVVTGFPLRKDIRLQFDEGILVKGKFTALVMGGSQGAHKLNEVASSALCQLHKKGVSLQVMHLAGKNDESDVRRVYELAGVPAVVFGFLKDMGRAYGVADIAICRAGAASCMELSLYKIPALLIPLPSARRDHQRENARVLESAGAADVIAESDLTSERLGDYVENCVRDRARLDKMKQDMQAIANPDAASKLADLVVEQVEKK